MLIESKKLIGLPVYTKSGESLGEVDEMEINIDEQLVVNYQVGSKNPIKNLFNKKLLVHRSQVISITAEKVIVDDNVYLELSKLKKPVLAKEEPGEIPEGAVSANIEIGDQT